jgi:hypothetical protein
MSQYHLLIFLFISLIAFSHPFSIRFSSQCLFRETNSCRSCSSVKQLAKKESKIETDDQKGKKFRRIVNVSQIPKRRSVVCRLVATEEERQGIARMIDFPTIPYFAANVTLSMVDTYTVKVKGIIEAKLGLNVPNKAKPSVLEVEKLNPTIVEVQSIKCNFESLLLNNIGQEQRKVLDDEEDFDDEVPVTGDIDIGEIVVQYFDMESGF